VFQPLNPWTTETQKQLTVSKTKEGVKRNVRKDHLGQDKVTKEKG